MTELRIQLVPESCHYSNLRTQLPRRQWDVLRKTQYEIAGYRCEICDGIGKKHPVECHEQWEYISIDDPTCSNVYRTQKLMGLIALCPLCHQVVHWAGTLHRIGDHYEPVLMKHLAKVNKWTKEQVWKQTCYI